MKKECLRLNIYQNVERNRDNILENLKQMINWEQMNHFRRKENVILVMQNNFQEVGLYSKVCICL